MGPVAGPRPPGQPAIQELGFTGRAWVLLSSLYALSLLARVRLNTAVKGVGRFWCRHVAKSAWLWQWEQSG